MIAFAGPSDVTAKDSFAGNDSLHSMFILVRPVQAQAQCRSLHHMQARPSLFEVFTISETFFDLSSIPTIAGGLKAGLVNMSGPGQKETKRAIYPVGYALHGMKSIVKMAVRNTKRDHI